MSCLYGPRRANMRTQLLCMLVSREEASRIVQTVSLVSFSSTVVTKTPPNLTEAGPGKKRLASRRDLSRPL